MCRAIHTFSNILKLCIEHFALEITDGQSWPNYIEPKRDKLRVYTFSPEGGVVWDVPYKKAV